jgi:hypothetical protein
MAGTLEQISGLLHEAGETHHQVFRIVDAADDDRASLNAQWLTDLPELPDLLGVRPVRSELIYLLVSLDKRFTAKAPGAVAVARSPRWPWEGPVRASLRAGAAVSFPAGRCGERIGPVRNCRNSRRRS